MDVTIAELGAPTKATKWVTASRVVAVIWLVTISFTLLGLALIVMTNGASVPGSYGFPGFTSLFAFSLSSWSASPAGTSPVMASITWSVPTGL